jgi:hypothetical protein
MDAMAMLMITALNAIYLRLENQFFRPRPTYMTRKPDYRFG